VRARLDEEARVEGWAALHSRLVGIDPIAARRIHPNDPQRIQRALEVYEIAGRPLSQLVREDGGSPVLPYRLLKLVRAPEERSTLHHRIEKRFAHMLKRGLEDEVRGLWSRGDLAVDMPSMRCVGYRQMLKYLFAEYTYEEMVERSVIATRQLAKRQLTWLRAEPDARWLLDRAHPLASALRSIRDQGI
jgi:tRNA dimethylallyltransferase